MKRSTKAVASPSTTRSNKGRITRVDQAWVAAHREAIERGRVADIYQAMAEAHIENIERGRTVDIGLAMEQARAIEEERDNPEPFIESGTSLEIAPSAPNLPTIAPQLQDTQTLAVPIKFVSSALLTAGKADIRYYLNGVFIHAADGDLRVCGTDGHRLIVSRFELAKGTAIPEWAAAGVIIPRDELAQALPILEKHSTCAGKVTPDSAFLIDYTPGAEFMTLRAVNGFASFKVKPIDGKFPDYAKVLAGNAATLARGEIQAMEAAAINTKYLKGAADIAGKLGAISVRAFVGGEEQSAFFTFDGCPDTVLIVMPMRSGVAVGDGVVKILGKDGVGLSIAAFRAHMTRVTKAIQLAKNEKERKDLESKRLHFEGKISHLLNLTNPSNQLTHTAH